MKAVEVEKNFSGKLPITAGGITGFTALAFQENFSASTQFDA
jgi:hypothetical protein